jgi:MFS transporter, DHA2 family, multidrug resistance protein
MKTIVKAPTDMRTAPAADAHPRRWSILAVLCLPLLLVVVAATVLNVALPSLAQDLRPTSVQTLWIIDGYALVLSGLLVAGGTLADRTGRKRALIIGCALFGLVSLAAGFAGSAVLLIVFRVLLGVSAAAIMPSTLSILRNVFPDERERTLAVAIWTGVGAGGAAAGPILGGLLVELYGWQAAFWAPVPVIVASLVLVGLLVPESYGYRAGKWDVWSALLLVAGIVAVVYAVKELKHGFGPMPPVLIVTGIALLAVFVRRQRRSAHRLLDLSLFADRRFSMGVVCVCVGMLVQIGIAFFLSQYFQYVLGYGPMAAGLGLAPLMLATFAAAAVATPLLNSFGLRTTVTAGFAVALGGLAVLVAAEPADGYWPIGAGLGLTGLGTGVITIAATAAIMNAAPAERAGGAAAIQETGYELGAALGVALLGSVMNAAYSSGMPAGAPEAARDSLAAAVEAALPGPMLDLAKSAFLDGLTVTYLVSAGVLLLAAVAAFAVLPGRKAQGALKPAAH